MKLHEYQAKGLLKKYGVPVPDGAVASSEGEAVSIAAGLGWHVVLKAQIHAGGRGKGGGIKFANDENEVRRSARTLLGMTLVTPQTGPGGKKVSKLLIEKTSEIERELYVGVIIDRSKGRPIVVASASGGMEIEQVAVLSPEKILTEIIDPFVGFSSYQGRRLAFALDLDAKLGGAFTSLAAAIYRAYVENDTSLIEINPLVLTREGKLIALDLKIELDDNSLYRHKDLEAWRDITQEDPSEAKAKGFGISYVSLNGGVGCMVNGAGLAMATMDLIKLHGGEPANFLDVGGGVAKENVAEAFKIILGDPKVKSIFINIFGGIVRCDVLAEGIAAAARELLVRVPVVVRLQGTNAERGREILSASGLNIVSIEDFSDAAKKAVELCLSG